MECFSKAVDLSRKLCSSCIQFLNSVRLAICDHFAIEEPSGAHKDLSLEISEDKLVKVLVDIALEEWRFHNVFNRAMSKLEYADSKRYSNQYTWLSKKITLALQETGFWFIDSTGEAYDPGMRINILNMDEFPDGTENLFIEQMQEPIIMNKNGVYKRGSAILGRTE